MNVLILSDIHGNLNALDATLKKAEEYEIDGLILLGDLIDYGMRSNEVIKRIDELDYPVLCNIFGNHENAVFNENYERFSSERGVLSAKRTRKNLNRYSFDYISRNMDPHGKRILSVDGKKILCVHGSEEDAMWKSVNPEKAGDYSAYDFVLSGHSHYPHFFEKFYATNDPVRRNKKKTVFINPGSVGQPRNNNPCAQFAVFDIETERVIFEKVAYDIVGEQNYFDDSVDAFYRERLKYGV